MQIACKAVRRALCDGAINRCGCAGSLKELGIRRSRYHLIFFIEHDHCPQDRNAPVNAEKYTYDNADDSQNDTAATHAAAVIPLPLFRPCCIDQCHDARHDGQHRQLAKQKRHDPKNQCSKIIVILRSHKRRSVGILLHGIFPPAFDESEHHIFLCGVIPVSVS